MRPPILDFTQNLITTKYKCLIINNSVVEQQIKTGLTSTTTIINWYSLREAVAEIPLIREQHLVRELLDNKHRWLQMSLLNLSLDSLTPSINPIQDQLNSHGTSECLLPRAKDPRLDSLTSQKRTLVWLLPIYTVQMFRTRTAALPASFKKVTIKRWRRGTSRTLLTQMYKIASRILK